MKRALLALLLVASLSTSAKTLRYASAYEPGTMDPHAVGSAYATRVLNMVYDTLVSRDEDFKVAPGLALSWTSQPTGWRFKLRPGVKFHDGTPFGADDVVFSIERALSPKTKALISLAVAAQIPCTYCIYSYTEMAKKAGASEQEIEEAVAISALTRHWSTIFNGMQIDLDQFKKEMAGP